MSEFDFEVALSFAGEDRTYVEDVANWLKKMDIPIFYDNYEKIELWGKDLYTHLSEIYNKRARFTVMFISKHYADKLWTNHERKSAQARAFTEKEEYILPVRFDNTEIPGILSTIGYIDLNKISPKVLAFMIKEKVGPILRSNYFPNKIDRLYDFMEIKNANEQKEIFDLTEYLFNALKLMEPYERKVLFQLYQNSCPSEIPENLHINIEYFSRILSISKEEIISIFKRLDSLDFNSRIYEVDHNADIDSITKSRTCLEIKFEPLSVNISGNITFIIIDVFDCITDNLCENCAESAIERLDFSTLDYLTGYSEKN